MAGFGSGAGVSRCGGCKGSVVLCSVLLILAALQRTQALDIVARVQKVTTNTNVVLTSNNDYYEFHGRNITIYCYCRNDDYNYVTRVDLRHNGFPIPNVATDGCADLVHDLRINSTHEGTYQCVAQLSDGTFRRTNAGHLHAIDPAIIEAPRVQYGLLNRPATLNCSVSINGTLDIRWTDPRNSSHNGAISSVQLDDEGEYKCEVFLSDKNLAMKKPIQFTVIVPPTIISQPNHTNSYTANQRQNVTVIFQSKMVNETHISWYKDDNSIQDSIPERQDQLNPLQESKTELVFNPIRRSDGGEYRVVIENSHAIIPSGLRAVEAHFTVKVSILPATPTGLNVHSISDLTATLAWTVPSQSGDDYPDNHTVIITGRQVVLREVANDTRQLQLDLIPGQSYSVQVVAWNQDGNATSEPFNFQALTGAPLVSGVEVRRSEDSNNTLQLTVTVDYTGGGTITHFIVSFRPLGTNVWIPLHKNFTATEVSLQTWTAQVADDRFQESAIELQVSAVSSNGHISTVMEQTEEIVLPEAPEQVEIISSDYESAVLRLLLSSVGTAPLTHVEVEFLSPQSAFVNLSHPNLQPGGSVELTLPDLEEDTVYTISLAVYNYGGKGMPTQNISVTTRASPPLAVYGIALVVVSGAILLIAIAIMILVVWTRYSNWKQKQRAYSVAQAENNQFTADHEIVRHGKVSPLSPVSPTPPTPSTATSILTQTTTPRPSPPGFYPTPPYCSSSVPYLPNDHAPSAPSSSTHTHSAFKFEAGSSRSNSVNQDSDVSDSSSPRYTYTFLRSVEGTPQIGRAYDKVDLPTFEPEKPNAMESRRNQNMPIRAYHMSQDRIRFGDPRIRPSSATTQHKVAAYVDIDSPQLRTQSSHSVSTTQTRLTSSDNMSTRESLAYPPTKTNTSTNV